MAKLKADAVIEQAADSVSVLLAGLDGASRIELLAQMLGDKPLLIATSAAKPDAVSGILLKAAQREQRESLLDNPVVKAAIDRMTPRLARNLAAWVKASGQFDSANDARKVALEQYKATRDALAKVESSVFGKDSKVTVGEGDTLRDVKFRIAFVNDKPIVTTGRGSGSVAHKTQFEPGATYVHRDKDGSIVARMVHTQDGKYRVSEPVAAAGDYNSSSTAAKSVEGGSARNGRTYWRPI